MKNLTIAKFTQALAENLQGVVDDGDILRVEMPNADVFVVMDEPEYKIMQQALAAMFVLKGMADKGGNIGGFNIRDILSK